jgi:Xaa-Pro aminopeptidase
MSFNFNRRLVGLQEKMEELDLDLVVYGSCQNFQYLTGLLFDWRRGIDLANAANNIFVPREGEPILTLGEESTKRPVTTWVKEIRTLGEKDSFEKLIRRVISDLHLNIKKVGVGDHVFGSTIAEIAGAAKGAVLCKAEHLMDHVRMIKDPAEIDRLRKVAALTDRAVQKVVPKIKKGVTQREMQVEVEYEGRRLGASDASFPFTVGFVKSGSEISADPFTYPRDKGLVPGTSIAFDVGFVLDGYCSDFGRSFYFGPADEEVEKGYEALQQSVVETVDKMREGSMRVCDVFPEIEKVLDRLGYGDYLRARLPTKSVGHNIGVEVHEPPWLEPGYTEELRANMVMALEPKLWHVGEYYLRVEDIVLVGRRKAEFLTKFDRELFQL